MPLDIYRRIESEDWSVGVLEFSELCELCVCFGFGDRATLYTEYFSITLQVDCCIFMLDPVCFYV